MPRRPRRAKVLRVTVTDKTGRARTVGTFDPESKTFRKSVSKRRHFLWSKSAWCIDRAVVKGLAARGCTDIIIRDRDSGDVYASSFSQFATMGTEIDLGHGVQVYLPAGSFSVTRGDDGHPKLFTMPAPAATAPDQGATA